MSEQAEMPKTPKNDEVKAYEVGYLLSPLVAADQLTETVEKEVKRWLEQAGATIGGEMLPRSGTLAYPIKKIVEHKGSTFREAYLGAIYFTCRPEKLALVETGLKKSVLILRSLVITLSPAA